MTDRTKIPSAQSTENAPSCPNATHVRTRVSRAGQGLLIAALAAAAPPALASDPSVESQILTLEKGVNEAYARNDLPRYFAYYAEDFRGLFPEGITNKADYVKSWTAYINGGSKIVDFTWSNMVITVSAAGDAAVASYHAVATSKEPTKPPTAEKYDETDVWFKRNGTFELVEVQYSDTGRAP
jgi:ketosteroid isomerase-like protein